jgi:hypothetical protein
MAEAACKNSERVVTVGGNQSLLLLCDVSLWAFLVLRDLQFRAISLVKATRIRSRHRQAHHRYQQAHLYFLFNTTYHSTLGKGEGTDTYDC